MVLVGEKVPTVERLNFEQLLVFPRSAPQCIYIPGQILNMYIPATVAQNGWKRKDTLTYLIVRSSEFDSDFLRCH